MDEKKKGINVNDSDKIKEEEYEPTKDAFMADMSDIEEEIASEAYDLVAHALNLVNSGYYDDAIELFYQAIGLYTQINKIEEVNALKEKLEEIKDLKSVQLESENKSKIDVPNWSEIEEIKPNLEPSEEDLRPDSGSEDIQIENINKAESEEEVEEQIVDGKIQSFIENQKKEQEVSEKAYELMGEAKDLVESNNFDDGIELYQKSLELFKELNWSHEIGELEQLIARINQQKAEFLRGLEKEREIREKERKIKEKADEELKQKAALKQNIEETKIEKRLKSLEIQKFEAEQFEREIAKLVDKAERLAREYEIARKKALKEGKLIESNPYPEIIEIYEDVRKRLLQKGWKQQASIYRNQVQIYQDKLQKDKQLREIEAKKAARQKEIDEMYKISKPKQVNEGQRKDKVQKEKEDKEFQEIISKKVNKAERLAREYEIARKKALREGELLESNPYPEIIEIYEDVKNELLKKGWKQQAAIYRNQVQICQDKLQKDKQLREIEAKKVARQKEIDGMYKISKPKQVIERQGKDKVQKEKEDKEFQEIISTRVSKAERLAREYEIARKKALKEGKLIESNPYPEIIEIYEDVRKELLKKGWDKQAAIYNNQIKIYHEKLDKDKKLREVEALKAEKQKEIEEMHKIGTIDQIDDKKLKKIELQLQKEIEEKKFEEKIDQMVLKAERLARDYELELKKGNFDLECPYEEVVDIYRNLRNLLQKKGWTEEASLYANQIQTYKNKLEKDKKLRNLEREKIHKHKEIENLLKAGRVVDTQEDHISRKVLEQKEKDERFQTEISNMVNKAEKFARDYETEIKKGNLNLESPYSEVLTIYRKIRKKLLEKGWVKQAEIYMNQIKLYKEKASKVEKLKEVEARKAEKQKQIHEMHKLSAKAYKEISEEKPVEIDEEQIEKEQKLNEAMKIIEKAENEVKNYELKLKPKLSEFESPYPHAISLYEKAIDILTEIGWKDVISRLRETIEYYNEKEEKDKRLRREEKEKPKEPEIDIPVVHEKHLEEERKKKEQELLEQKLKREQQQKIYDEVFEIITQAEQLASDYQKDIEIDGILKHKCPYEQIIKIYQQARSRFQEIDWTREAEKLTDSIQYYREKLKKDTFRREEERERLLQKEQEKLEQQQQIEAARREKEELIRKQEEELRKEKELKQQFEQQKNKAFNLMDQAKMQLDQKNFDEALNIYKKSKRIFEEIEWDAGINLINESISLIHKKKRTYEQEQQQLADELAEKEILEKQIEEEIARIEEVRKMEEEQKRKELLRVQEEKLREKEISEKAYKVLKEGTNLMDNKQFDSAYEKIIEARSLFEQLEWKREVSRINNDLLYNLSKERELAKKQEKAKKRREEEKKQLKALLEQAEKEREKEKRKRKEEKRKRLMELRRAQQPLEEKMDELDYANILIKHSQYNEAVLKLKQKILRLQRSGKQVELKKLRDIIDNIKNQSDVPLLSLENPNEYHQEYFETAYKALDKAQILMNEKDYMKAISELSEAKYNIRRTKPTSKLIKDIDASIQECRSNLGKQIADTKEKEIELDDLKSKIAERRSRRRKRIQDLMDEEK